MSSTNRSVETVLADLERQPSTGMRFQITCAHCGQHVWVSSDAIGNQMNCRHCDAVITIHNPDGAVLPEASVILIAAGTGACPSPYSVVAHLDLSPESNLTDMFNAWHDTEEESEALCRLRDPVRRLACDLLCYPDWRKGSRSHGSG